MSFPDLTTKIKINDKPLLNEKITTSNEEKEFIKEKRNVKKSEEKLSEYVAILLSKSEKEGLERIAAKDERSVSYMVRKAIRETYKI